MSKRGITDIESNGEIQLHESELESESESESTPMATRIQKSDRESMYEAASKGNLADAGKLLERDPSLAYEEISERGERALHIAVYTKNTELVRELVKRVDQSELEMHDGRGYSPCCYAARTGVVEVADIMMQKNANLGSTRNRHSTTPLQLAVFYGNAQMALRFLMSAQVEDLLEQEWFHLLLVAIRSKMYDVASEILEKNRSLAVKKGVDQRTALHVLAQLDISSECKNRDYRKMEDDFRKLGEKLWAEIEKLGRESVVELIRNPPILHDAAKVGNVELISMITRDYPEVLRHRNSDGCSIYHTAVMYRQHSILELMKQSQHIIEFNAISEDVNGNNILHFAGKLLPPDAFKTVSEPDVQMKTGLAWFKEVEKIVPPFFKEQRNVDGYKPIELFWMEHKRLLEESVKHMKSTAESGMLVATIILTVVFAAAFTPPGGSDQVTGFPIHLKENWFISFAVFEVMALFSSTDSILTFWSIISSNYEEQQFLNGGEAALLRQALSALLFSVLCACSAFLSAFFLVFVRDKKLVLPIMIPMYVWLVVGVSFKFFKLFPKTNLVEYSPFNDVLWRLVYHFGAAIVSSVRVFIRRCFSK